MSIVKALSGVGIAVAIIAGSAGSGVAAPMNRMGEKGLYCSEIFSEVARQLSRSGSPGDGAYIRNYAIEWLHIARAANAGVPLAEVDTIRQRSRREAGPAIASKSYRFDCSSRTNR